MILEFEKWQGTKNDFILVWTHLSQEEALCTSLAKAAPRLCAKDGTGIGADGILILVRNLPTDLKPSKLRIINADGSEAAHCGNGLRCAAGAASKREMEEGRGIEPSLNFAFLLGKEEVLTQLNRTWQNEPMQVAVAMGVATINRANSWYASFEARKKELTKLLSGLSMQAVDVVHLRNNHVVISLERPADAKTYQMIWEALQSGSGLDGINVHFAWEIEPGASDIKAASSALGRKPELFLEAVSYERGVGYTPACGSGASAIGIVAISQGFCEGGLMVKMPGGRLFVSADDAESMITLHGPCEFVFSGRVVL